MAARDGPHRIEGLLVSRACFAVVIGTQVPRRVLDDVQTLGNDPNVGE